MRLACFILLAVLAPAIASVDETGNFARYQIILDRMPFGDTTAAAAAATEKPVNPNLPPLSSVLRLVALEKNDKTGAIQAGIVEIAAKKNHYLIVGEEEDGVKLVEVEYTEDRALVRKGDQEEWLSMSLSGDGKKTPAVPPDLEARRAAFLRFRDARRIAMPAPPPPEPLPPPPNVNTNSSSVPNQEEEEEETDEE